MPGHSEIRLEGPGDVSITVTGSLSKHDRVYSIKTLVSVVNGDMLIYLHGHADLPAIMSVFISYPTCVKYELCEVQIPKF